MRPAPVRPASRAEAFPSPRPVSDPPDRGRLLGPRPARPRLRRLFDPVSGWFRRLERRANVWMCGSVYPRLPGLHRVYDWQLDHHLTVSEAVISLPDLPPEFDGLKVLLVTDLHMGPFVSPAGLRRAFDRLLGLSPELVFIGGDTITGRVGEFAPHAALFGKIARFAPTFAVLGNHDHYSGDPEALIRCIDATGVRVLHNRAVHLTRGAAALRLAGVDDLYCGAPDLDAAVGKLPPAAGRSGEPAGAASSGESRLRTVPTILLSHNPDIFFAARRRGVSLVLSGHTHGGQIRFPSGRVLVRMSRYRLDEGHYVAPGAQLIVSRGMGATGLPLRIGCSPEAVFLTLAAAPAGQTAK